MSRLDLNPACLEALAALRRLEDRFVSGLMIALGLSIRIRGNCLDGEVAVGGGQEGRIVACKEPLIYAKAKAKAWLATTQPSERVAESPLQRQTPEEED